MNTARYIIQTKQIEDGAWLGCGWRDESAPRSRKAAIALADAKHAEYATPKRAVDTKTGEVIYTVGDDAAWNAYADELRRRLDAEKVVRTPSEVEACRLQERAAHTYREARTMAAMLDETDDYDTVQSVADLQRYAKQFQSLAMCILCD